MGFHLKHLFPSFGPDGPLLIQGLSDLFYIKPDQVPDLDIGNRFSRCIFRNHRSEGRESGSKSNSSSLGPSTNRLSRRIS